MFLIAILVVAHLHFAQVNGIPVHPTALKGVQLHEAPVQGIPLKPAHPTIVTSWAVK